ncbi:uncharacterized protein LOC133180930 [Saccostrea echinata]|uniref:uncharacterized protein LOC133180930 n=1 Tax=Saccostrea echinata TaxID=191078 RepID=UPI002A830ABA|nr:uncharacterized protein LOC133180930 [Saccostrea echinata]
MEPPGCNLNENNIEDVKKILWSTLLFNYSSHSLCNRNFETDRFLKFLLFYVTSVWIGYDLDCQTMIQWQENEYRYLKKDFQHAIIALGSFLVAIQFLWLFKLIKQEKFTEFRYKRGDRPSGIKRAMKKFLYTPIKTYTFSPGSLGNILLNSPTFRFSAVVNWTILLFIGLYRVLYRHAIAEKLFHAHFIMYSNEPLCDLVGSSTSCTCDLIFMMVSSYLVVFIATAYYEYIPPGDKIEIFKKKCKFSKLPEYFKNKFNSGKYLQDGWKAKLRNILSKAQLQNITFILGLPIATILVVVGLIIFAAFYLLKILIEGLLIPHLFFRKCNSKSKWWIKVLIMITFPITLRPMISSLLFILRSATYIIFVLLPLHQQLLRSFVVGMSIIVYAIKYEIEMVDLNAKILLEILKDQSEPYIEEKFYTFVKKGLKRSLKNVKFFICKCFLAFIYFLITLQTIYKSKNSTGHQEFFLSVFVIGLPWIADAYFNRKTLTEKDKENIGSLVEKYKKQSGLNVP